MEHTDPEGTPAMDTLISEIQTFGEIESLLRSGLDPEQVYNFMVFRAEIIDLMYRSLSTPAPGPDHAAAVLNDVVRELQLDVLASPAIEPIPARYDSPTELLAACHAVVAILQNSEAPDLGDTPVTREAYLAAYSRARVSLPASLLTAELFTQISDLSNDAGVWHLSE